MGGKLHTYPVLMPQKCCIPWCWQSPLASLSAFWKMERMWVRLEGVPKPCSQASRVKVIIPMCTPFHAFEVWIAYDVRTLPVRLVHSTLHKILKFLIRNVRVLRRSRLGCIQTVQMRSPWVGQIRNTYLDCWVVDGSWILNPWKAWKLKILKHFSTIPFTQRTP